MRGFRNLPAALTEPDKAGTVILAAADEHTRTGLARSLGQLPWPVRQVSKPAGIVHEVNDHLQSGAVVLASFDPDDKAPQQLAVRLAAFPRGSNYLVYILDDHKPETIAAAFEAGADDVMIRPLLLSELRARLDHAWQFMELERLRERIGAQGALMAEMATATVVHSRNYLNNELARELERSRRYGHAVSVIIAEAAIQYGPAEGALRAAGRYLLGLIRKDVDWIARLGRRSFAIVLPETGIRNACATAQRLSRKLQNVDLEAAGIPDSTTWHFGVSGFDRIMTPDAPSADLVLTAAGEHLRTAKRHGANAVAGGLANVRAGVEY